MLKPFKTFNQGKKYKDRIKPFGFMLSAHTVWGGCPTTAEPDRFHLVRAFERRAHLYERLPWINRYTGVTYDVTTAPDSGEALSTMARVQSYATMLRSYETHREPKSADLTGAPCDRRTKGLLSRRHIHVSHVVLIGKETNEIEQVAAGAVQNVDDVQVVYSEPNASGTTAIPSILANLTDIEIARRAQLSPSAVRRLRKRKPQPRTLARLQRVAADLARERALIELPADNAAACAAFDTLPDSLRKAGHRCKHCAKTHCRRGYYCSGACRQAAYRQSKG